MKRMLVEIRFVSFNWITHGSRNLRNPRRDANFWYALPIPSDLRSLLAIRFLLNRWYVCRCWEFDFANKSYAKLNFSKCKHPINWCSEVWHMSVSFPVRCSFLHFNGETRRHAAPWWMVWWRRVLGPSCQSRQSCNFWALQLSWLW